MSLHGNFRTHFIGVSHRPCLWTQLPGATHHCKKHLIYKPWVVSLVKSLWLCTVTFEICSVVSKPPKSCLGKDDSIVSNTPSADLFRKGRNAETRLSWRSKEIILVARLLRVYWSNQARPGTGLICMEILIAFGALGLSITTINHRCRACRETF